METLRSFFRVIDRQTVVVTGLALLATWLCRRYGIEADLPSALIGIAVIFPIVFSINSAYKRREEALSHLADAKAHAVAIAWAHRDWTGGDAGLARGGRELVMELFGELRRFFRSGPSSGRRRLAPGGDPDGLARIYALFSRFSQSHEALRRQGVPANEVSRANQYLRAVMIDFERMRNILEYRTPKALRAYSRLFLNAFPVLYGPYFARVGSESMPLIGYAVAIVYSVVLVSLDNIQEALENPYGLDEDDLEVDLEAEIRLLLEPGA